ncbi:hypothetical protein V1521DRAFT_460548 [Lipomyces starkeyi]
MTYPEPKPPSPYISGRKFWVRSHTPPSPTWTDTSLTFELARERESIHPLERFRTGDRHNAQLVTIRTEYVPPELTNAIPTDGYFVAKIYDPLYFDHEQDDEALLCARNDYPKVYGTFTLGLPAIAGKPMTQLEPTDYSQAERQDIIKALIEAESLLYTNDVYIQGMCLCWTKTAPGVIVDFGKAWVGRAHPLLAPEAAKKYLASVPISPLLRCTSFAGWIDWDWEPGLEHHFGSTRASITKDMEEVWRP